MKKFIALIAVLALMFTLSAFAETTEETAPEYRVEITADEEIPELEVSDTLPLTIALPEGYTREEPIDVTIWWFDDTAGESVEAAAEEEPTEPDAAATLDIVIGTDGKITLAKGYEIPEETMELLASGSDDEGHDWHHHGRWLQKGNCVTEGVKLVACKDEGCTAVKCVVCYGAHEYGEYAVTSKATCTKQGVETAVCELCDDETTKVIKKKAHTPVTGSDGTDHWEECEDCGKELTPKEEHTPVDVVAVEATCTEDGMTAGKKCSGCGKVLEGCEVIPALGHTYSGSSTEMSDDGVYTHTDHCVTCGKDIPAEITYTTDATTHKYTCPVENTDVIFEVHDWDNTGKCTVCGYQCKHEVLNLHQGMSTDYTKIPYYHTHKCDICGIDVQQEMKLIRTTAEYHVYQDDACKQVAETNGRDTERHKWANGVCKVCGYECAHDWKNADGKCTICGETHDHSWNNGKCLTCEYECEHPSMDTSKVKTNTTVIPWTHSHKCAVCDVYVDQTLECVSKDAEQHVYQDDVCKNSTGNKISGEHIWNGDVCTVCGRKCEHDWSDKDGVCKYCGTICSHDWGNDDGVCKICGYECTHPDLFANAETDDDYLEHTHECGTCGADVDSKWTLTATATTHTLKCNKTSACDGNVTNEEHTWNLGECLDCGYECKHAYDKTKADGECIYCGMPCTHEYDKTKGTGKCVHCGQLHMDHDFTNDKLVPGASASLVCNICGLHKTVN